MPRAEAPAAERELFLHILDALDTGLLAIDEDRRVVAINDTLAKGWGVDRSEIEGLPLGEVFKAEVDRWYLPERAGRGESGRGTREIRGSIADREVLMRYSVRALGDTGGVLVRGEDLVDADSVEEGFPDTSPPTDAYTPSTHTTL